LAACIVFSSHPEPDREGVAMAVFVRQALIAIAIAVIVVAIADFVLWETATESQPSEAPNAEPRRSYGGTNGL
jgi:hypothetical protein